MHLIAPHSSLLSTFAQIGESYVFWWKLISILITGGLGALALLKNFHDKETDRVTSAGWVALTGIVISTGLGIAAQAIESNQEAVKSAKATLETR